MIIGGKSMSVTIRDVAKKAGVSVATVSYVLNDDPEQSISPETRDRIKAAVEALGYTPLRSKKPITTEHSKCIGIRIEAILSSAHFSQIIEAIRSQMLQYGYNVMLCTSNKKPGQVNADYIQQYLDHHIDGIIYIASDNICPTAAEELLIARKKIPFVAYDVQRQNRNYCCVDIDYGGSAMEIAQCMAEKITNKLVYFETDWHYRQEQLREAGVREAMKKYPDKKLIVIKLPITKEAQKSLNTRINQLEPMIAKYIGPKGSCNLQPGDGLLSSWMMWLGTFQNLVDNRYLYLWGGLGDVATEPDKKLDFISCRMPNYAAGVQCAKLLMDQIEHRPVDNTILKPAIIS
jgi:DNA-binding LacI/PurR family transcriptional regulator